MAFDRQRRLIAALILATGVAAGAALDADAQPIAVGAPGWKDLSPTEQQILAPLATDWDKLEASRKLKWRGIARRYPTMTADQQQRVQQQMQSWARLSPAEREAARQQYRSMRSLPPEKKQEVRERWEQYQSLPPETRRELATQPSPGGAPQASPRGVRPAPALPPPTSTVQGDTKPPPGPASK